MLDGGFGVQRPDARQREDGVARAAIVILQPVKRGAPAFLLNLRPAVRQPEFGAAITAISDKGAVLAIGHRPRGDAEGPQQDLVTRQLVVEAEARTVMADERQPARNR